MSTNELEVLKRDVRRFLELTDPIPIKCRDIGWFEKNEAWQLKERIAKIVGADLKSLKIHGENNE